MPLPRSIVPTLCVTAAAATLLVVPVEAQTGTLVVLNKGAASASVIDVASGTTLATLPTGDGPHELVISRDGRIAVGADYGGRAGGNTLTVVDVPRLEVVRTIALGRYARPHGLAFLPGDSVVVLTSESTRTVVFVRIADGEIVRTISTDQDGSHMLALVEDASRIYTSNIGGNSISELDVAEGRRTRTFAVPARPEAIAVTADGTEVWAGSNAEGTVNVLHPASGAVERAAEDFGWPYRILFSPDQRLALIPDLRRHELRVLDRISRRQIARMPFPDAGPQGIIFLPDASHVVLSLSRENRVAMIETSSWTVVRYYQTGAGPDGVGYSPVVVAGGGR